MKLLTFLITSILCLALSPSESQNGLYVSAGANFYISSGTVVSIDGLVLTPSANYNITGTNLLQRTAMVAHPLTNPYIRRVYRFNRTISAYSGKVTIYYQDSEVVTTKETALNLYVNNGSTWRAYTTNVTRDATTNYVATSGLTNIALNEVTLGSTTSASIASTLITNEMSSLPIIYIEQNIPNPFSNSTIINYYLPGNVGNAYVNFYTATGVLLKSEKLNVKGKGTINFKANELSAGVYKYALVIDGKLVSSKQMIKAK